MDEQETQAVRHLIAEELDAFKLRLREDSLASLKSRLLKIFRKLGRELGPPQTMENAMPPKLKLQKLPSDEDISRLLFQGTISEEEAREFIAKKGGPELSYRGLKNGVCNDADRAKRFFELGIYSVEDMFRVAGVDPEAEEATVRIGQACFLHQNKLISDEDFRILCRENHGLNANSSHEGD